MKKTYKGLLFGLIYALLIALASIGGSLLISGFLFGKNGINSTMVDANNLLMGTIGTLIIVILTKRYYQRYSYEQTSQVDFFTNEGVKILPLGIFIGFIMIAALFISQLFLGAEVIVQGVSPSWLSFLSTIATFIGMAVFEECIFRGILRQAFSIWGNTLANLFPIFFFIAIHMELWVNFDLLRVFDLIIAGLFFTLLLQKTGSLMFVSAVHAAYNIFLATIFGIGSESGLLITTSHASLLGLSGEQISTISSIIITLVTLLIFTRVTKDWQKANNLCSKKIKTVSPSL